MSLHLTGINAFCHRNIGVVGQRIKRESREFRVSADTMAEGDRSDLYTVNSMLALLEGDEYFSCLTMESLAWLVRNEI